MVSDLVYDEEDPFEFQTSDRHGAGHKHHHHGHGHSHSHSHHPSAPAPAPYNDSDDPFTFTENSDDNEDNSTPGPSGKGNSKAKGKKIIDPQDIVAHKGGFTEDQIREAFERAGLVEVEWKHCLRITKGGKEAFMFAAKGVKPASS